MKQLLIVESSLLHLHRALQAERHHLKETFDDLTDRKNECHAALGYGLSNYAMGEEYLIPVYARKKALKAILTDYEVDPDGYGFTLFFTYKKTTQHGEISYRYSINQRNFDEFEQLNPGRKGEPLSDSDLADARLNFKLVSAERDNQQAKINELKDPLASVQLFWDKVSKAISLLYFPVKPETYINLPRNIFGAVEGKFRGIRTAPDMTREGVEVTSADFPSQYGVYVAFDPSEILYLNPDVMLDPKKIEADANELIKIFMADKYIAGLMEKYNVNPPVLETEYLRAA